MVADGLALWHLQTSQCLTPIGAHQEYRDVKQGVGNVWPVGVSLAQLYSNGLLWILFLTHCHLVTPYDDIDLGQHWIR